MYRSDLARSKRGGIWRASPIKVEQNDWRGIIDTPKGGRGRIIPMTNALASALTKNGHLRGDRVLTLDDGSPAPGYIVRDWVERAQRRAGLEATGNVHIPPPHVLLAPGDARGTGQGHPGARRARAHDDDAAVHASVAGGPARGDRAAQRAWERSIFWRYCGDGRG
jgi:hypothetical protein